jgi:class 3 adenylate cyclase
MDYTIIGGELNLAIRLEAHADAGGILMAAETYSLVKDDVAAEEREAIVMKGFSSPIRTFSVIGIHFVICFMGTTVTLIYCCLVDTSTFET